MNDRPKTDRPTTTGMPRSTGESGFRTVPRPSPAADPDRAPANDRAGQERERFAQDHADVAPEATRVPEPGREPSREPSR